MRNLDQKRMLSLAAVAGAAALFLAAWASGYSIALNRTASMPRGLYLVGPVETLQHGSIVAACIPAESDVATYRARGYLPDSPRCAAGLAPVLKPIAAMSGDSVALDERGLWVNGEMLPNSRVFDTDSQGQPIRHLPIGWTKVLTTGELFLLANHIERSLDSRYYGTVARDKLLGKAVPLILF